MLTKKLFPNSLPSIFEIEKRYPVRKLEKGAMVTRFGPSPTGFVHIGSLYTALICDRLAHQSQGIFFLRIEDTDKKREIKGATDLIIESLKHYKIKVDEGPDLSGADIGIYEPYIQSNRAEIYQAYLKLFLEKGLAYPCFLTPEEIEEIHKKQEVQGVRPGYYGEWAIWRHKSEAEILQALEAGKPFILRFKSNGDFNRRMTVSDLLRGTRDLPENDQDIVIMKSDGLPTYHFAHLIDDHLMQTTHVIRGDEWFSSLPLHLQLFKIMGWQAPQYGHIFPIQKTEGHSKRKLSKRKDPEANVFYYDEQGYPVEAIIEYLLNLANSNFEDWRKTNPSKNNQEFILTLKRLAGSNGAIFDLIKLNNISKEIIVRLTVEEVFKQGLEWAKKYALDFAIIMENNQAYFYQILNIEKANRKDIAKWLDLKKETEYFIDELFNLTQEDILKLLPEFKLTEIQKITNQYLENYNFEDSKEQWFEKIKLIAIQFGYAESLKNLKASPEKYKGYVADIVKIFRVLLTGRIQTPDLYSIMQVMGKERVLRRVGGVS